MNVLTTDFYARPPKMVAHDLIGKLLVHATEQATLSGIITETEAYGHTDDPASHAYRGKTKRNFPMFGPVGRSYVYFVYGNHYCFNVVAHEPDAPAGAVLIRALFPLDGTMHMQHARATKHNLTNGPGKLTQALGITTAHNNLDLIGTSVLKICSGIAIEPSTILTTVRIGIRRGCEHRWRFVAHQTNQAFTLHISANLLRSDVH
jgi:DNA-3-methyladenine glycosylase